MPEAWMDDFPIARIVLGRKAEYSLKPRERTSASLRRMERIPVDREDFEQKVWLEAIRRSKRDDSDFASRQNDNSFQSFVLNLYCTGKLTRGITKLKMCASSIPELHLYELAIKDA